jgi:hypothetical protein
MRYIKHHIYDNKTGQLISILPEGNLEFFGRKSTDNLAALWWLGKCYKHELYIFENPNKTISIEMTLRGRCLSARDGNTLVNIIKVLRKKPYHERFKAFLFMDKKYQEAFADAMFGKGYMGA